MRGLVCWVPGSGSHEMYATSKVLPPDPGNPTSILRRGLGAATSKIPPANISLAILWDTLAINFMAEIHIPHMFRGDLSFVTFSKCYEFLLALSHCRSEREFGLCAFC